MIYKENEFEGVMANDTMCLNDQNPDTCLDQQKFYMITATQDNYTHSGFIGVGPIPHESNVTNYVTNLYNAG